MKYIFLNLWSLCLVILPLNALACVDLPADDLTQFSVLSRVSVKVPGTSRLCRISVDEAAEFFMEKHHPLKPKLDAIFTQYHPLESATALRRAGFKVVSERPSSMRVLSHPLLRGYLLKLYPLNEKQNKERNMCWAINRCLGAKYIRELIASKNLKHFSVPMKWIYCVPEKAELEAHGVENYIALVVEDMRLVPKTESRWIWASLNAHEIIDELYAILSQGYSSCALPSNIPYTEYGKFSCIDTESPQRLLPYHHVNKHLSPDMQAYWDKLVKKGGNTPGFILR